ncbi:MAG TPA: beta-L-arabinofuranosidase domain-containing protein [Bryobacteraceae bacterium]
MRYSVVTGLILCSLFASAQTPNRAPLTPNAFDPLPLGSVKPAGWLLQQLKIQRDGLTGHLDEFWPDLSSNSAWLGGTGEGWERGPYYLDGLVPLAYELGDAEMIAKARRWVNWTLEHQREDGFLGPQKNQDWWPDMIMLKVLTQYQEATNDPRVIPALEKFFAYQARTLQENPLKKWAIYRWGDELYSILWLYNRNGDGKLLDLARNLSSEGYDWKKQFDNFTFTDKVNKQQANMETHGVNNAMAMKTSTLWSLVSGSDSDRRAIYRMLQQLDEHHGLPDGIFSCDEHYAGRDPSQGTELCTTVEAMFSYEILESILGDPMLGDRLEKVAYNALPGALTADMWAHQYDEQPNQVLVSKEKRQWSTNGPDSNLFGLEPNFGCCTANYHQGWPKFVAGLWMAPKGGGLAAMAYGPSEVHTTINQVPVTVSEETNYPFAEQIRLTVNPSKPVHFPLLLRIPIWARPVSISVNGFKQREIAPGSYFKIDREWKPGDQVEADFTMDITVERGFHRAATISRGPLVFSLKIGEKWKKLAEKGQTADWSVEPKTPWNYALMLDGRKAGVGLSVQIQKMGNNPFTPNGTPVVLVAMAKRVPDWKLVDGSAGPVPESPLEVGGSPERIELIPFAAAKLRITAFPVVKK